MRGSTSLYSGIATALDVDACIKVVLFHSPYSILIIYRKTENASKIYTLY